MGVAVGNLWLVWLATFTLQPMEINCMYEHHTLVDTSFKLISDFCHVDQGVLCCEHAEQASSRGVFEGRGGGGGDNRFAK